MLGRLTIPWRGRLSVAGLIGAARGERLIYAGIFGAALAMRLVDLAAKPFHHDESLHARFAWELFTGQGYEYDPVYHGPVQFYLSALMYALVGAGDFGIRLAPALLGAAITVLPYFLRRQLGSAGALVAALALCLSPAFLYYSRFAREDIYAAFATLVLVVLIFRFLERPRRWHPAAILGVLAVSFATKETTYILAFVMGTFFAVAIAWQALAARRGGRRLRDAPLVATIAGVGRDAWIWAFAVFALVFTLLFSTFLFEPQGLRTGLVQSIAYWLSQQPVNRGGQPWFYYLVVLPGYELPILILAGVGVALALRRPTLLRLFLVWHAALSLIVYSWASERMPWLTLHILLPLILLAGLGFQTLWRRSTARPAATALAVAGVAFLLYGGVHVAYVHPADPAELLVFTQTSPDVLPVEAAILSAHRAREDAGRQLTTDVDAWGGTSWPWAWYLRDTAVGYPDMSIPGYVPRADVVVVAEVNHELVRPALSDYRGERFRLREWWVVDYAGASPGNLWRWFVRREAWSVKGTLDEWRYVRVEPAEASAAASG